MDDYDANRDAFTARRRQRRSQREEDQPTENQLDPETSEYIRQLEDEVRRLKQQLHQPKVVDEEYEKQKFVLYLKWGFSTLFLCGIIFTIMKWVLIFLLTPHFPDFVRDVLLS